MLDSFPIFSPGLGSGSSAGPRGSRSWSGATTRFCDFAHAAALTELEHIFVLWDLLQILGRWGRELM